MDLGDFRVSSGRQRGRSEGKLSSLVLVVPPPKVVLVVGSVFEANSHGFSFLMFFLYPGSFDEGRRNSRTGVADFLLACRLFNDPTNLIHRLDWLLCQGRLISFGGMR